MLKNGCFHSSHPFAIWNLKTTKHVTVVQHCILSVSCDILSPLRQYSENSDVRGTDKSFADGLCTKKTNVFRGEQRRKMSLKPRQKQRSRRTLLPVSTPCNWQLLCLRRLMFIIVHVWSVIPAAADSLTWARSLRRLCDSNAARGGGKCFAGDWRQTQGTLRQARDF